MANISETEISMYKGISTKLDDDTVFILAYLVHTEEKNRGKSEYIYAGRIEKIDTIKAEIDDMKSDAKCVDKWTWKNLPKYTSVSYTADTNKCGAKWLNSRLRKAVDWDTFCKLLDGWKETKKAFNDNAKYVSVDYVADDGTVIADLKQAKSALLNLVGHTIQHKVTLKSQI